MIVFTSAFEGSVGWLQRGKELKGRKGKKLMSFRGLWVMIHSGLRGRIHVNTEAIHVVT